MNKFNNFIVLTTSVIICGSILVACGRAAPTLSYSTPLPTTPSEIPAERRTLVFCMDSADLDSLYPYKISGSLPASTIKAAIYDGPIDNRSFDYQPVILKKLPSLAEGDAWLVPVEVTTGESVVDAGGTPVELEAGVRVRPSGCQADDCAIEYDGSSPLQMDQLVARFELLPGLLWSDGEPLSASDSVYSFYLQSHPDTPARSDEIDIERTASYQALDELTTEWRGLPGFLDSTYFTNFFTPAPEHAWGHLTPEELVTAEVSNDKPLGWGPYVIEDWDPEVGVTLTRNEHYFRQREGLPRFDHLAIRFVEANLDTNLESLLSGECDVVSNLALGAPSGSDLEMLSELSNQGEIKAAFVTGTLFWHLDFGIQPVSYDDGWQPGDRPDFFSDVRVRRAFALCMDRQRVLEVSTFPGQSSVPETYVHPQHPLYNPDTAHYAYDPDAGAALLEAAGWDLGEDGVRVYVGDNPRIPPGTNLSVTNYALDVFGQKAAQVMADALADCGIEVDTSYWGGGELFWDSESPVFGRVFDLTIFLWLTGASPPCDLWLSEQIPGEDQALFPLGWEGQNDSGFSHLEYDQACLNALQSLPGQPGYVENHLRAQEIFAEQLPVIPLYFDLKVGITRPDFCGYILDPTENVETWNIEAFDYGPDC